MSTIKLICLGTHARCMKFLIASLTLQNLAVFLGNEPIVVFDINAYVPANLNQFNFKTSKIGHRQKLPLFFIVFL